MAENNGSAKSVRNFLTAVSLLLVALAIVVTVRQVKAVGSAQRGGNDPSLAPFPEVKFPQGRSMVVTLQFNSRTEVDYVTGAVASAAAHTHVGDPPHLKVTLLDAEGAVTKTFNTWHPLWQYSHGEDGHEHLEILDSAEADFIFPFEHDLALMRILDQELDQQVAEIDIRPIVVAFCTENPGDASCEGFSEDPTPTPANSLYLPLIAK